MHDLFIFQSPLSWRGQITMWKTPFWQYFGEQMNLSHNYKEIFTIQSMTTATLSGDPVYESPKRTIRGVTRTVNRMVRTAQGERMVQVDIFESDEVILPTDRYWLPGADVNNDRLSKRFGKVTKGRNLNQSYTIYRADL